MTRGASHDINHIGEKGGGGKRPKLLGEDGVFFFCRQEIAERAAKVLAVYA